MQVLDVSYKRVHKANCSPISNSAKVFGGVLVVDKYVKGWGPI